MNALEILKEFQQLENKDDRTQQIRYDVLCLEAYKLTGGEKYPELLDEKMPLNFRVRIAQQVCKQLTSGESSSGGSGSLPAAKLRQGETAKHLQEILKDPQKYGLEDKNVEEILDAAWFISGTSDRLNKDDIDRNAVKDKIIKDKESSALTRIKGGRNQVQDADDIRGQYMAERKRIADKGVSDEEMRRALIEERVQRTITYYEEVASDDAIAKSASNSAGDLYSMEESLALLAAGGGKISEARRNELLSSVSQRVPGIGGMIDVGNGAQFFANPAGFLASKAGSAASKAMAQRASAFATKAAIRAGLQATGSVVPIIGNIAAEVTARFIAPIVNRVVYGTIDNAKKAGKRAVQFVAGALLLGIASFGSGLLAAGAAAGLTTVVLPFLVALIMFIVNSGGYIVPPSTNLDLAGESGTTPGGPTTSENQWISITKRANPPGPFGNDALPQSVEYTITITAKSTALTNVKFLYSCSAYGATPTLNCPPDPTLPAAPAQIDPGTPFVIKYTQNYSTVYRNSIVMDSLTVSANAGTTPTGDVTAFASVIFGKPPTRCFVFSQNLNPNTEIPLLIAAIGQMNREAHFMDLLCAKVPQIFLERGSGQPWGGRTNFPRIYLYDLAFSRGLRSVFYTLTHETGHIFANALAYDQIFQTFTTRVAIPRTSEGYICTYPANARGYTDENRKRENFAESVALYFLGNSQVSQDVIFDCLKTVSETGNIPGLNGTFQKGYPSHYSYMRYFVFN